MAGLFSGYNNAGPGVSKDEPQKKEFFHFFELYGRNFWKLMLANLLYVLVSLPVVTRGLAEAGMAYVTRSYARRKPVFFPSDFFDTIKKNWKQSLAFGLFELIVGALIGFSMYYYFMSAALKVNFGTVIALAIALYVTLTFVFMRYYAYLQIITFKFKFKQILKNSLLFAAGGIKRNLVITGALLVPYTLLALLIWFVDLRLGLGVFFVVYLLMFPAFRSFLIQFTVFPVVKKAIIDPYYAEHPNEDIEKRQELGLDAERVDEPAQPEEPIFTDTVKREKEESVVPKQYGADELARGKKLGRSDADEDGTI